MLVRRALPRDLKALLDYMEEKHPASSVSEIPFDRPSTARMLNNVILSREHHPLIAFNDSKEVVGILIGAIEPYFFNQKRYYVTDLFFISDGGGVKLWREFKKWAFSTRADKIIMGVSSGEERAGKLLEILGMENTGGMYVLRR